MNPFNVQALFDWLDGVAPEESVPKLWGDVEGPGSKSKIREAINRLLVIQSFRPDRLMFATSQLVAAVLGEDFVLIDKKELNLSEIIESEVSL